MIHEFCSTVLPGLLQTWRYAEGTLATFIDATPQLARQVAEIRLRRQAVLHQPYPPEFWAIIDECTLARGAGGSKVMSEQLRLPFKHGLHPGPWAHMILLEMPEPLSDFVYIEDNLHAMATAPLQDVAEQRRMWKALQSMALSPGDSTKLIRSYL